MRNKLLLSTAALALAFTAAAQDFSSIKFNLPYPVTMGASTMAAGDYVLTDRRDDGNGSLLEIRSADGGPGFFARVTRVVKPTTLAAEDTRLVFRHTADKYELQRIWVGGQHYGFEFLSEGHQQ